MENENNKLDNLEDLELDENENSLNENNDNDLSALQEEKQKLSDKNRKLFERAKKSETEVKELREQLKKFNEKPEEKKPESQSNEPDYGKLAYLEAKGINNPDDIKIVEDEAGRLKLSLTDVLQMEHIKNRLKAMKEDREAKEGMPSGQGRTGGATKYDVDYWLAKGELPNDQELAEKVVNAKMKMEEQNKFSDVLYN